GKMKDIGGDIMQGLLDGLGNAAKKLGSFLLDKIPGWIKTPFKKALGINSPSRVFRGYGKNIIDGLVVGMDKDHRKVVRAAAYMARGVESGFGSPELSVQTSVNGRISGANGVQ